MSVESTVDQMNELLPPAEAKDPGDGGTLSLDGVRKKPGDALRSLFRFDCVRLSRLFETLQAAVLYSSIVLFLGAGIDRLFQGAYPVKRQDYSEAGSPPKLSSRQFFTTLLCVLGQVGLSCLAVFYVRHIVDAIPFLNLCPSSYISGLGVSEVLSGELSVALVFVGVQTDLLFQLEQLRRFIVGP